MSVLLALLGDPVARSLSPRLHQAALEHLGVGGLYLPLRVRPAELPDVLRELEAQKFLGCNLTVPLKEAALPLLDEIEPAAKAMGAVNTVVFRDGKRLGFNTDLQGFTDSLDACGAKFPAQARALILGAGGAARACVMGLVQRYPMALIELSSRDRRRSEILTRDLQSLCPTVALSVVDWQREKLEASSVQADIIVHATTMRWPQDAPPLPAQAAFRPNLILFDLAYPRTSAPLAQMALQHGWTLKQPPLDGLEMLVRQAALSFSLWMKTPAPVEVMRQAVAELQR